MIENKNVYVGNRYVPKIMGEWNSSESYEGLSIVTNEGNSYTSKKSVPVGVDLSNENYWVSTGIYNAQIEKQRQDLIKTNEDLSIFKFKTDESLQQQQYYQTPEMFGAVGDGLQDDTLVIQEMIDKNIPIFFDSKKVYGVKQLNIIDNTTFLGTVFFKAIDYTDVVLKNKKASIGSEPTFDQTQNFNFDTINIDCDNKADYGIYFVNLNSVTGNTINVNFARLHAVFINYSWLHSINKILSYNSYGDGITIARNIFNWSEEYNFVGDMQYTNLSGYGSGYTKTYAHTIDSKAYYGVYFNGSSIVGTSVRGEHCKGYGVIQQSGLISSMYVEDNGQIGTKYYACLLEGNGEVTYLFGRQFLDVVHATGDVTIGTCLMANIYGIGKVRYTNARDTTIETVNSIFKPFNSVNLTTTGELKLISLLGQTNPLIFDTGFKTKIYSYGFFLTFHGILTEGSAEISIKNDKNEVLLYKVLSPENIKPVMKIIDQQNILKLKESKYLYIECLFNNLVSHMEVGLYTEEIV